MSGDRQQDRTTHEFSLIDISYFLVFLATAIVLWSVLDRRAELWAIFLAGEMVIVTLLFWLRDRQSRY